TLTVTGTTSQDQPLSLADSIQVDVSTPGKGSATPATCVGGAPAPNGMPGGTDWTSLGDGPARSFCTPGTTITAANVGQLRPQWRFPTVGEVTASPAVATIPVNGTPPRLVFDGDFNGMFYAVDAATGLPAWSACLVVNAPAPAPVCDPAYPTNSRNQVDYGAIVASPAVASVGATQRVFEAATDHLWALEAATGRVDWTF